jgi:signal transduction histidine kinase
VFSRARWRLTIWFAAAVIVILALIGVAVLFTTRASLFDQVNSDLEDRVNRGTLASLVGIPRDRTFDRTFPNIQGLEEALDELATAGGYFYALVSPNGDVREHTSNVDIEGLADLDDLERAAEEGSLFVDTKSSDDEDLRIYVVPGRDLSDRRLFLEVGRSTEPERQALRQITLILAGGGAVGVALAVAGGFVLSGLALRPIKTAMVRQRSFIADASHELRTPLTLIRANAELLQRPSSTAEETGETAAEIIAETDRLNNLVSQLLTLARADADHSAFNMERIDLAKMASDTAHEMRLLAKRKQIAVESDTKGPVTVEGDDTRLRELITILIDNAIKYSDEGSSVKVSVEKADGQAHLIVSDNGRGIPTDALPRIFDRFYRADKARSREIGGTGLGLAIAKWIVDSHDGNIEIDSRQGEGTTVSIELPAAT